MYNVVLVNLAPDARSVAAQSLIEQRDLGPDALRALLAGFCEIDPIENAAADTEIRVQVRRESYLLRTEQKKFILYDTRNRDLPGQIFDLEQVMSELDGSAAAARHQTILQARADADPGATPAVDLPVMPPPVEANKPRMVALTLLALLQLGAILYLRGTFASAGVPAGFSAVGSEEAAGLQDKLTGVYMTGNEPGQHGIVVTGPAEFKLFELAAVEAPRVVYVSYKLGRVDAKLCLATDQPGGRVEIRDDGALVYGGEVYQRIP